MSHSELILESEEKYHTDAYGILVNSISNKSANVTVIGQGYVGLPLAVEFARSGFNVKGVDTNPERVKILNDCISSTPDVQNDELHTLRDNGYYEATTDYSILFESDVILICVPTPLRKSKDPDISYVLNTVEKVAENLRPGQLIILESTTYPGTTEELLLPLFQARGYHVGKDFFLAFSPERIDPGNAKYKVKDIPKITGGITQLCTNLAAHLYRQIVDNVIEVSSPIVAELSKLYENVFRSVNIALANEFSMICRQLRVNTQEVIDAAASKPFGFMPFYPGPGIGGHCIPVDPSYLSWKMRFNNYQTRFIPLAEEINQSMPAQVVQMVTEALNNRKICLNGARVLVLGVAYKRGVGDTRESPALQIVSNLMHRGVDISYIDSFVPAIEVNGIPLKSIEMTDPELVCTDCVLILTDHPGIDYRHVVNVAPLIVDTRGATWKIPAPQVDQIVRL